jgi:hypothetical protein
VLVCQSQLLAPLPTSCYGRTALRIWTPATFSGAMSNRARVLTAVWSALKAYSRLYSTVISLRRAMTTWSMSTRAIHDSFVPAPRFVEIWLLMSTGMPKRRRSTASAGLGLSRYWLVVSSCLRSVESRVNA